MAVKNQNFDKKLHKADGTILRETKENDPFDFDLSFRKKERKKERGWKGRFTSIEDYFGTTETEEEIE